MNSPIHEATPAGSAPAGVNHHQAKGDTGMVSKASNPKAKGSKPAAPFTQVYDALLPHFSGTELKVYWVVKSHDRGQGAWPLQSTIARAVGTNDRTVRRALKTLASAGAITVKKQGRGAPDKYRFPVIPAGWTPPKTGHQCPPVPSQDRTPVSTPDRTPVSDRRIRREEKDTNREGDMGWDGIGTSASGETTPTVEEVEPEGRPEDDGPSDDEQDLAPATDSPGTASQDRGYNEPLADQEQERLALDLVAEFTKLRNRYQGGQYSPSEKQRQQNLKSARLLVECDKRPHRQTVEMLRWAYADVFWSSQVPTLYQFRYKFAALALESQSRRPKRWADPREPHGRVVTNEDNSTKKRRSQTGFSAFATSL